jgi:IS30 family transposase
MPDKSSIEVVKVMKGLHKVYGNKFSQIFKTITCDNGGEFAMANFVKGYGTEVYFAHPYSAFERGSNENQNKMIRRLYPKGTDFAKVTNKDIKSLQDFMNSYPRAILGGYSSAEVAEACMAG